MTGRTNGSATVALSGTNRAATLPFLHGTLGPPAADIRGLYGELGVLTFDPGYQPVEETAAQPEWSGSVLRTPAAV